MVVVVSIVVGLRLWSCQVTPVMVDHMSSNSLTEWYLLRERDPPARSQPEFVRNASTVSSWRTRAQSRMATMQMTAGTSSGSDTLADSTKVRICNADMDRGAAEQHDISDMQNTQETKSLRCDASGAALVLLHGVLQNSLSESSTLRGEVDVNTNGTLIRI